MPFETVALPRSRPPWATRTVPPVTGSPSASVTVAVTVARVERTTTRAGETVAVVTVSVEGTAVPVAGIVTVVPLGCAVTTNVAPAGMADGAVNSTVAAPFVTVKGLPSTGVSPSAVCITTSTVEFAGLPSEVRSSLLSENDTASPAPTDCGTSVPKTWRRSKAGSSGGSWWLRR